MKSNGSLVFLRSTYLISLPIHAKAETDVKKCKFYSISYILFSSLLFFFAVFFLQIIKLIGTGGYRMEVCKIQALDKASTQANMLSISVEKSFSILLLKYFESFFNFNFSSSFICIGKIASLKREQRRRHPSISFQLQSQ
jgi:hypothetical protein